MSFLINNFRAYGIRNLGVGSPPGNVPHFHNMNIPPGNLPNNIPNDNAGPGNVPPGQPQQPAPNAAQQQNDRGRQGMVRIPPLEPTYWRLCKNSCKLIVNTYF